MKWKIIGGIFLILIISGFWFILTPIDIRPAYLHEKITEQDVAKGQALLKAMQDAYGGKEHWLAHKTGSFAQIADWYGDKMGIAGWDELPQQFQMTSTLGTDDSEFMLLNGPNKGQTWGVQDWNSYLLNNDQKYLKIIKSIIIS